MDDRSQPVSFLGRLGIAAWAAMLVCLLVACRNNQAKADDACPLLSCLAGTCFDKNCDSGKDDQKACDDKEEEPKCSYGPCDCQPRKTLMQWSYGTTFSDGPPGMDEPLEADRPGFTESPVTVGRGVLQIESGYMFTTDSSAGVRTSDHSFPQTLFRIGMLAEWFEFRLQYNYEINDVTLPHVVGPGGHLHSSGSDDLLLGMKFCLTPQEKILPAMGIIPSITVPSGSPAFTQGEVMPGLEWAYSWEINKVFSLEMTTGIDRERDDAGNIFTQFAQAASLGFNLTKNLGGYTELYMFSPTGRTTEQVQYGADGGFTYRVTNNLQLDIEAGVGLNAAADDFFAGAGAVVRF
jgi:hypothetical protein